MLKESNITYYNCVVGHYEGLNLCWTVFYDLNENSLFFTNADFVFNVNNEEVCLLRVNPSLSLNLNLTETQSEVLGVWRDYLQNKTGGTMYIYKNVLTYKKFNDWVYYDELSSDSDAFMNSDCVYCIKNDNELEVLKERQKSPWTHIEILAMYPRIKKTHFAVKRGKNRMEEEAKDDRRQWVAPDWVNAEQDFLRGFGRESDKILPDVTTQSEQKPFQSKAFKEQLVQADTQSEWKSTPNDLSYLVANALRDILKEREFQDKKHGVQNHDMFTWLAILQEEMGEFANEALSLKFTAQNQEGINYRKTRMRAEAVSIGAVALAMLECLDHGGYERTDNGSDCVYKNNALDEEIAYYEEWLEFFLREYPGKWVAIKGKSLGDVFDNMEDALRWAYSSYGTKEPFLVRQVLKEQPVHFV